MEIRIKAEDNMSKAEEIKVVEKLHDAFKGTCNYLTDFFSEGTCNWLEEQIRNDFSCDIFPYIEANIEEIYESGKLTEKQEMTIKEMDKQIQALSKYKDSAKAEIDDLEETIYQRNQELNKQSDKIALQAQEIIQLKAELYDLIRMEGNAK